jgi:hypothetical protein
MLEKTGRWDEALALCQDILDRAAPAPVTRLCPTTWAGVLMARRGEATAWEYLDLAMAAGRAGRALPAAAQRALGEGRPAVDRPGLPVRGRAGPAGHGRGGRAAGGAEHLHRARRVRRGPAHPAAAARARRTVHPGRPQVRDPGIHSGSPGASARSSGRSAPGRPTRRSRRSCSSRPRPSTTTSPPCSPSSARRTATPPRPRPPSSACSPSALSASALCSWAGRRSVDRRRGLSLLFNPSGF